MSEGILNKDVLVGLVVVPVVLGFLRAAFSREIDYWVGAWMSYRRRPFDLDRDPKTPDWCQLYNPGSGTWDTVSLVFRFTLWKGDNGVFVTYYDPSDWSPLRRERVPYSDWSSRVKARIIRENAPGGLMDFIRSEKTRGVVVQL